MSNQPDRDRVTKKAVALLDSVEHLSSPRQINECLKMGITDAMLEAKAEEALGGPFPACNPSCEDCEICAPKYQRAATLRSQKSDAGKAPR